MQHMGNVVELWLTNMRYKPVLHRSLRNTGMGGDAWGRLEAYFWECLV